MSRPIRFFQLVALCLSMSACSSVHGSYVWADEFAVVPESRVYTIGRGDLLFVHVWDSEKYSTRARVRTDGQISVPLLDDLDVAGKTPPEASRIIEERLRADKLLLNPHVTVAVEEMKPLTIAILGAVARPGTYALERGNGVADALASAGGLTEFAHKDRIFVLRRTPAPARIRFTLAGLTDSIGPSALFQLRAGDVLVAED